MKRKIWSCALGAMLAAPVCAYAEEEATDPNTGAFSLTGGADYVTAYFFRGYNQEDSRFIVQPWATLTASLLDSDNLDISAYGGAWNSVQARPGPGDSILYETDYYGGVDFAFAPFTLGGIYTVYTYPGDAFESVQEVGLKFAFDDTATMEKVKVPFALKPYAGIYLEVDDDNGTEECYLELGLTPSFAVHEKLTISVPVVFGCSIDDYYLDSDGDNSFLGYISVGLMASTPIPLPAKYGAWTLTGGVTYLYLAADSVEDLNDTPSRGGIGNGDDYMFIGKVGISFAY